MNALAPHPRFLTLLAFAALSGAAGATTIPFDLQGKASFGLLPGNENGAIAGTPGSGGEVGSGILYDDATNILTLNIAWGSANGFMNLTGNASAGHIHGPTTSGGTASFTQNATIPSGFGLDSKPGWNASATSGGFSGTVTFTDAQEIDLLAGKFYVNIHTSTNGGGEIRGNLVQVPEPASAVLLTLGAALIAARRRAA